MKLNFDFIKMSKYKAAGFWCHSSDDRNIHQHPDMSTLLSGKTLPACMTLVVLPSARTPVV